MALSRRFALCLFLTATVFLIFYNSTAVTNSMRKLPQKVGLGETISDDDEADSSLPSTTSATAEPDSDPDPSNWNPSVAFKPGSPLPAGYNFSATFVFARTTYEDVSWVSELLPEIQTAIYVANDPNAPLHPPKNKGHEVMVYLTYIIDHYDNLPDISVFLHAHRVAWHNNDVLGLDAVETVRRLSFARVWREGYMPLRCSWSPGCPDWMHPGALEHDATKKEQGVFATSWSELFPLDAVPATLAQPCCSQFALSRERILAVPLARFVWYRDWLLRTPLSDYVSGRVWEYVWQVVFTGEPVWCPKEHVCYCDGFGVCFGGEVEFARFVERRKALGALETQLKALEGAEEAREEALREGRMQEAAQIELPPDADELKGTLRGQIDVLSREVQTLLEEAKRRGEDPRNRALEAGREWHEGDGF